MMQFIPAMLATPGTENNPALWLIFHDNNLLVAPGSATPFPVREAGAFQGQLTLIRYLGTVDENNCYTAQWIGREVPEGFAWYSLRQLYGEFDESWYQLAGRAAHLNYWTGNHRFCGRCGAVTVESAVEVARVCTSCGFIAYPRIAPAVIVAVVKEGEILLARGVRFSGNFYSVIAGFVEPGETLEECVRREIREETGIEVCNIRYFASQPWPFPDSLMVAFTAEYAGGELVIDPTELVTAGWFTPDNLPEIPGKMSVARKLIDWFVNSAGMKKSLPK